MAAAGLGQQRKGSMAAAALMGMECWGSTPAGDSMWGSTDVGC